MISTFLMRCLAVLAFIVPAQAQAECFTAETGLYPKLADFGTQKMRFLDRTGQVLTYETVNPDGTTQQVRVLSGFFLLEFVTASKTLRFEWQGDLPDLSALEDGQEYRGVALVSDDPPYSLEVVVQRVGSEIIEIDGCTYETWIVAQRLFRDGKLLSWGRRWFHPWSGMTLRVRVVNWSPRISPFNTDVHHLE